MLCADERVPHWTKASHGPAFKRRARTLPPRFRARYAQGAIAAEASSARRFGRHGRRSRIRTSRDARPLARSRSHRGRRDAAVLADPRLCLRHPMARARSRDRPVGSADRAVDSSRAGRMERPHEPGVGISGMVSPVQPHAWIGARHRHQSRQRSIAPVVVAGAARRSNSQWPDAAAGCGEHLGDERHRLLALVLGARSRRPVDRPK